ncbi:MAG: hypothetical protein Q8K02_12915, partial [Flavobacterium sp.]|nr:hypothetical protein [Flavobacterium sp.]
MNKISNIVLQFYKYRRNIAASARYRKFDLNELSKVKRSDTIFVLGSSPSINELTEDNWREIARQDSLALNRFCFHEHVPTFYWLEFPNNVPALHFVLEEIRAKYNKKSPKFILNFNNVISTPVKFDLLPGVIKDNSSFILPSLNPSTSV